MLTLFESKDFIVVYNSIHVIQVIIKITFKEIAPLAAQLVTMICHEDIESSLFKNILRKLQLFMYSDKIKVLYKYSIILNSNYSCSYSLNII